MGNVEDDGRPSRVALRQWLRSKPGRTQAALGEACGVAQQTISDLKRGKETPSERLADLIHRATRGAVHRDGWKTDAEKRDEDARRTRASKGVAA